jgi:hypothetical protein
MRILPVICARPLRTSFSVRQQPVCVAPCIHRYHQFDVYPCVHVSYSAYGAYFPYRKLPLILQKATSGRSDNVICLVAGYPTTEKIDRDVVDSVASRAR